MAKRICPWWLGYFLASPLRRLMQDPGTIVEPYVQPGMTVLEPGPGMGFFTLELARRVGTKGRLVAVDVQPRMIAGLKRRLRKAGLLERVEARLATADSLGVPDLQGKVDFTLAMAVVHEMPSASWFFGQAAAAMKAGGQLLLAEPSGHVTDAEFQEELQAAAAAGFVVTERPEIRRSYTAVLRKAL
ncbi:MAG TPA: methyltransferase domain-containing protein [Candidatus Aquilonibacter sp.]|nr:methyltransferase domain-containing protein [Candidatus Aquilonibacter sp.]